VSKALPFILKTGYQRILE